MKFCNNCGNQLADDQVFCNICGANQGAAPVYTAPTYAAPNYAAPAGQPMFSNSDWDGSVFDTFVNGLVASLIISFSCGLATPWAICYMMKFVASHAIVDGKRIYFDGTGGSLFGNWLKWFLLTVVTCGIYSFWVTPRLYKWVVSHLHFQ